MLASASARLAIADKAKYVFLYARSQPAPHGAGPFLRNSCKALPKCRFDNHPIDFHRKPVENRMASAVPAATHSGPLRNALLRISFSSPKTGD
jgi:hypothetical protein